MTDSLIAKPANRKPAKRQAQEPARRTAQKPALRLAIAMLAVCLLATACGDDAEPAAETDDRTTVGIFVDNAFGDRAFFDIALGAVDPLEESGAAVSTYEGKLDADAFASILENAGSDNEIVFVLGFEAIDAMFEVAATDDDTLFVFIDAALDAPDVASIGYRDHEGCFLMGALAARLTVSDALPGANPDGVIGFVGGVDAPVIRRCETGYVAGAAEADPGVVVESLFVGSFVDPTLGREVNLNLASDGSDINYQYAGLSGEGGFDAAKATEGLYALGAGFDQSFLAPGRVPGSMLKNVDQTILQAVDDYLTGDLARGSTSTSGLTDGGLAVVYDDELVPAEIRDYVEGLAAEIASGERTVAEE